MGAVVAMAPGLLSGDAMRSELTRQIRGATGLTAEIRGRAVLALLPRPRIKFENVHIYDSASNFDLEADYLRSDLRLLPLIAGRFELVSTAFFKPRVTLDLDANPFANEGILARAMTSASIGTGAKDGNNADAPDRLGIVSFLQGTAQLKSLSRGIDAAITKLDLSLDWRRLAAPAGLKASFEFAGETANIAAWLGRPAELLHGRKSDISLRFTAPAFAFDLNGAVTLAPGLLVEGAISARTPDLRALAANLGYFLPSPGKLEQAALTAALRSTHKSVAISDLRLGLDTNVYEGALALDTDRPRAMLSGTLAAGALDLAPFTAQWPDLIEPSGEWKRIRLPVLPPSLFDVDLRLSAGRAKIGRTQLRDAAFSLQIVNENVRLTLREANAFNGQIKAQATARRKAGGYAIEASVNLVNVNSAALLGEAFRSQLLSGDVSGDITLASEGEALGHLLRGLGGEASLVVKKGDFAGLDLEQVLRRLEKRPLAIASDIRAGRTAFDEASFAARVENGLAGIEHFHIRGPGVQLGVTGAIRVPERTLDLKLEARQTLKDRTAPDAGPWLTMDVRGVWNDPELTIDARSLINRSKAAAPLLPENAPAGTEESFPPR